MEKEKYKYKFSVIIPVYNVENYLEETILSVINQTIGFEDNIQILLVNDGSTDNSEEICLKYQEKYPNNIKYIYQENQGVSSARNEGIRHIEGKYVDFLDSDDIWDINVFEKVYNFFEQYQDEIDVVSCRQKFFEAKEGYHKLDYKFTENRIVDIKEEYKSIQLSTSSAFIKADAIKNYRYDIRLKYSEDATLIGQVLMNKLKYGILVDAVYNYRKRKNSTSALQIREGDKSWYFDTIEYGYKILIKKSIEKFRKVLPYYQYQIMYDIQWRLNVDTSSYLSEDENNRYKDLIIEMLQYIDDRIILEQKYLWKEYKILALCLKYNKDVRKEFTYEDSKVYFKDYKICNIKNNSLFKITNMDISKDKKLTLEVDINCFLPREEYNIILKTNDGKKIKIKEYGELDNRPSIVGNLDNCRNFKLNIPIDSKELDIFPVIEYKSVQRKVNIIFDQLGKLSNENENLYFTNNNYMIKFKDNKLLIKEVTKQQINGEKEKYIEYLKENHREDIVNLIKETDKKRVRRIYIKFDEEKIYIMKTLKKWNDKLIESKKWKLIMKNDTNKRLYILKSSIIVGSKKDVNLIIDEDEKYIKNLYKFKYVESKEGE